MSQRGEALPRLHVVTDDEVIGRAGWRTTAEAVLEAGGAHTALHLRGPRAAGAVLYRLASELKPVADAWGATLIVNDRIDVALAAAIHSVQLGTRSLPAVEARRILGPSARIGCSTHDRSEVAAARAQGADWMIVGTVYTTVSHPGRTGLGPTGLAPLVAEAEVPVLGIGGIDVKDVAAVLGAGAHGIATMRGVWDSADPPRAVMDYIAALAKASGTGPTGRKPRRTSSESDDDSDPAER